MDRASPLSGTLYSPVAEMFLNAIQRTPNARVLKLNKVRILGFTKNSWNGECLTRCRRFETLEQGSTISPTVLSLGTVGVTAALTSLNFVMPSNDVCFSSFGMHSEKFRAPFRATVRGTIVDLDNTVPTRSGNEKRLFNLVDGQGNYLACAAQNKLCHNRSLIANNEVILFFGTGRGPIGSDEGMLYLYKDSWIIPIRRHSTPPVKGTQIIIEASKGKEEHEE